MSAHYSDLGRPAFQFDLRYAPPSRSGAGRHRAIIDSHAFVLHPRGESMGCNHFDDDCGLGREVRCGYYRRHHATVAVSV